MYVCSYIDNKMALRRIGDTDPIQVTRPDPGDVSAAVTKPRT